MTNHAGAPKDVLGEAVYDFLLEYSVASPRIRFPTAEDLAELFEPYVDFIEAQARESAIMYSLGEEAQRRGKSLFMRDYVKELRAMKDQALQRIKEERTRRRFQNPQLPQGQ